LDWLPWPTEDSERRRIARIAGMVSNAGVTQRGRFNDASAGNDGVQIAHQRRYVDAFVDNGEVRRAAAGHQPALREMFFEHALNFRKARFDLARGGAEVVAQLQVYVRRVQFFLKERGGFARGAAA